MDGKSSPPPPLGKPAKVFDCPSCGGSVSIRALENVSVACRSCGSIIDATNENYKVFSTVSKKLKVEPLIPIGQRGKLHGVLWEVIGFMQRCDGTRTYTWSEYLLFNPGRGFRWLTEFDGHWNYVAVTKEKPKVDESWSSKTFAHYMGKDYYLFHKGTAKVLYVVGEFYWKVAVGEKVSVEDYVAPPEILSCEKSKDEVTWAIGQYVTSDEVKAAFQLTKVALPFPRGVAPNQPSTLSSTAPTVGKYWAAFLALIFAIQFMAMVRAKNERVYSGEFVQKQNDPEKIKVTPPFELKHGTTNVDFKLSAPVQNSWLEIQADLVNDQTGATYEFEQGVEFYSGRDSDGSWIEGSQSGYKTISSIPDGMYHLNIEAAAPGEVSYSIVVRRDVITWKNFLWAISLISFFPAIVWWRSRSFEVSRWSTSDFSPYWEHWEDD